MKKSILTIGLLSLVMVLTSFTSSEKTTVAVNTNTTFENSGSGAAGGNVKLDDEAVSGVTGGNLKLENSGSGAAGGNVKLDDE